MSIAYFNGIFTKFEKNKDFFDQKGVFTTILVENGHIFFLKEHLQRIGQHSRELKIVKKPINPKVLYKLISLNQAYRGVWRMRIIITYNAILVTLLKESATSPKAVKLSLCTINLSSNNSKLKTLENLKRANLLEHAREKGFDDSLTFDYRKNILETLIANVFWIKDNTLFFPDRRLPYLYGITLSFAIKVATKMKMNICPGFFKLNNLCNSSVFYCNSMKKITVVDEIENIKIKKNTNDHFRFINSAVKLRPSGRYKE